MKNLSPENFLLLRQNPNTKAIITSSIIYTFSQLKKKVFQRASILKSQNVSAGGNVGILSNNDVDFVIDILALWQLSAVPVPINIRLNESEINKQLELANCKSVIVRDEDNDKVNSSIRKILSKKVHEPKQNFIGRDELKLTDPAIIIFTSGSTSKSKGITLSFNSLFNSAVNSNQLLRYTHSDRWLASLPFYHIGGFSTITRSLVFEIPLIIPVSISFEHIIESINTYQPTFISLVSAQLKKIVEERITPNPEMKNCLVGGGFTDSELIREAIELGWPVNIVYGSTETASFVTAHLKDEIIFKPNSVGRAVPTNKIFIFDSEGNELKPFEVGEIVIQSNSLMSGYLSPLQTNEVIKSSFYYTNDFGYLDEDSYLFIEGRKNYLISTGGENVNPNEIEKILLQHPLIAEAAVFPLKDQKWGEIIAAAVVLKDKATKVPFDDLKKFLQDKLPGFKIPKKIFFEDQLPKTELGKLEKEKLIDRYRLTSL